MQCGRMTVGTAAVKVPIVSPTSLVKGLRLLARSTNDNEVYMGTDSGVLDTNGHIIAKGDQSDSVPTPVPAEHFTPNGSGSKEIWLIGGASGQVVDWMAQ